MNKRREEDDVEMDEEEEQPRRSKKNKKKRAQIAELRERNNWSDEDVNREREKHAFLDMTDRQ